MSKLKAFWNQTSNIVAWAGISIAAYTLYSQEFKKEHDVSVSITSIEAADQEAIIGVLYRNNGDFQETVTDGRVTMEPISGGVSTGSGLSRCFTPVTIEPKKSEHKYYKVRLKRYVMNKNDVSGDTIKHELNISFNYLLPNNRLGNDDFKFGTIIHSISKGAIKEFAVSENNHKFSFNGSQNYGVTKLIRPLKEDDNTLLCGDDV